jgi:hypothetical protein
MGTITSAQGHSRLLFCPESWYHSQALGEVITMKLWLARIWPYWLIPLCMGCYFGGMGVLLPIAIRTSLSPDILFFALSALIVIGAFRIKRWADTTIAWHDSLKRFR